MSTTSEAIDRAVNALVAMLTAFNNEIGPDNGNNLGELYTQYGLSNPPTQDEFTAMDLRDRIAYRKAERVFEMRAVAMEDVHDLLVAIDPGTGPFGNLDAAAAWAIANMGDVGADVASNLDAFKTIRSKLAVFIAPAMLKGHSDAVHSFTAELATQISEGQIKS